MSVEYRFTKNFIAVPSDANLFTLTSSGVLIKPEDESLFSVSINGQRIHRRTTEPAGSFARYYFELDTDTALYDANITDSHLLCSFTLRVVANPAFLAPGYLDEGIKQNCTFSATDVLYIDYWYTIVGAA